MTSVQPQVPAPLIAGQTAPVALMKPALIALALSSGIPKETVKKWRQRGCVPVKHRESLLRSASRLRLKIQADDFVFVGTAGSMRAF